MSLTRVEIRSEQTLRGNKLGGYAAVFGQEADLGWLGKESFERGSFDTALKTSDTRSLWNHEARYLLGRVSAGTLRLSADSTGLEYEVDLPNTTYANDLRELAERGDLDGASIGFQPDLADYDRATNLVNHTMIKALVDVSPVTFPAYTGTSTEVRSMRIAGSRRRSQLIRARARITLRG